MIWDITALFDRESVPRVFQKSLPILLNGGVLFDDVPVSGERITDNGYSIMSDLVLSCRKELTITDLQSIIYRFCSFIECPQADFRSVRKAIHTLTQLMNPIRYYFDSNSDVVCRILQSISLIVEMVYRIFLTYIRKLEDLRFIVQLVIMIE